MAVRVLLVDDHRGFLATARRLLEAQGLAVPGVASSSAEALAQAAAIEPDVALVDVDLGGESGLDVARILVAQAPSLRIILISTHSEADLADLVGRSPAIGFIPKSKLSAHAVLALLA